MKIYQVMGAVDGVGCRVGVNEWDCTESANSYLIPRATNNKRLKKVDLDKLNSALYASNSIISNQIWCLEENVDRSIERVIQGLFAQVRKKEADIVRLRKQADNLYSTKVLRSRPLDRF